MSLLTRLCKRTVTTKTSVTITEWSIMGGTSTRQGIVTTETTVAITGRQGNVSPKPHRHFVSKGRYVQILGARIGLGISSGMLIGAGFVFSAATLVLLMTFMGDLLRLPTVGLTLRYVLGWTLCLLGFAGVSAMCFKLGLTANNQQKAMRNVVPMTRENVEDVPIPETLVRASVEPIQEQQTVLLRGATPTQEAHQEQLLRATGE